MRKVALEEAIIVPGQVELVPEHKTHPEFELNEDALLDVGENRLKVMDEAEIDLMVLSITTPGTQGLDTKDDASAIASSWNDYLVKTVQSAPTRYKAFASLATSDIPGSIAELERISKLPEFLGCMLNGFEESNGMTAKYFDHPDFIPMWQTISDLNIPIYIHPRSIPKGRVATYSPYEPLHGATWGFHIETAEHILRLIFSGLFDKHPNLKVVIGHMGELLPFWAWRIDHRIELEGWQSTMKCQHKIFHYLKSNIFVTTSGMFHTPALQHAISTIGLDNIMYSVDYPYEDAKQASQWFNDLELSQQDKEQIAFKNFERIFSIG